ncbi:MAG: hypothetical protein PHQ40_15950 [Anaerolineaceae bacterium]|nr:hypothetical protein [Anaerolineaceae bacterium]
MGAWLKLKPVLAACLLAGVLGGMYFSLPGVAYSQSISSANGLANTAWPMYQHDPPHTGRSMLDGVTSSPTQISATNLGLGLNAGSRGGMSIGVDGNLFVSYGDHLFALDPGTGAIQWQLTKGSSFSIATVSQDGPLYYGASDNLYALDPSGQVKW